MKNLGHEAAIDKILEAQGLSPTKAISNHFAYKESHRKRRNDKASRPEFKRTRKARKVRKKVLNKNTLATEEYTYAKDTELFLDE